MAQPYRAVSGLHSSIECRPIGYTGADPQEKYLAAAVARSPPAGWRFQAAILPESEAAARFSALRHWPGRHL